MKKLVSFFIVLFFCLHAFAQVPDPCTGAAAAQAISTASPCNCTETNITSGTPCNKSIFASKALADAAINSHLTTQITWALPNTPTAWQDVRSQALSLSGATKHEFCTEITTGSITNYLYIINIAQVQINCAAVCQDYKIIQKTGICATNSITPVLIPSALDPTILYRRYLVTPNTTYIICRQLYFDGTDIDCYATWVGGDGNNSLGARITAQHWFYFETNSLVVPINLVNFSCSNYNTQNYLKWESISNPNLKKYEIEKSEDGINFQKIGEIESIGIVNNQYNFTDDKMSIGNEQFYKLKIIAKDGSYTYSKIISIIKNSNYKYLSIAPNPAFSTTELNIFSYKIIVTKLEILNSIGAISISKDITLQKGNNSILLDVKGLVKGVYFIKIKNAQFAHTRKIMIL